MKNILFIIPKKISKNAVYKSQVVGLIKYLTQENFHIHLLTLESKNIKKIEYIKTLKDVEVNIYINTSTNLIKKIAVSIKQAKKIIKKEKIDYIYFRSIFGGFISLLSRTKSTQAIYNIRAVVAEESALRNERKFPNYYMLKLLEKILIKYVDKILCVSEPLKQYIKNIVPHKQVEIIPSCVNIKKIHFDPQSRTEIRKKLSINNNVLLTYVGGVSKWQNIDQIIKLFSALKRKKCQAKLLLITKDKEAIHKKLQKYNRQINKSTIIKTIPHKKVKNYLSAGDIGLLCRQNNLINRVASPIKFAEYLACGLPIIATKFVGDYSNFIEHQKVGITLPYSNINSKDSINKILEYIEEVKKNRKKIRQRCVKATKEFLVWNNYKKQILKTFQEK